jgi:hypothetical protein
MAAITIRIRSASHRAQKEIAAITGQSLQDELDQAVEERRRMLYLEGLNADYAALRKNPRKLRDFRKEMASWDSVGWQGRTQPVLHERVSTRASVVSQ